MNDFLIKGRPPVNFCAENTLYFLLQDKDAFLFVFTEFDHIFRNLHNQLFSGKCFYFTERNGPNSEYKMKKKDILNVKVISLGYLWDYCQQKYIVNDDINIKQISEKIFPALHKKSNNYLTSYLSTFSEEAVIGYFEPRNSLSVLLDRDARYHSIFKRLVKEFNIDWNDIGITGSLALGAQSSEDIDVVFYGDTTKLLQITERINYYAIKNGRVEEYGLRWPLRFRDEEGNLICCFLNNKSTSYVKPLMQRVNRVGRVKFKIRVIDDTYSSAKSPLLISDNDVLKKYYILNNAFKGVFRIGDVIKGEAEHYYVDNDGRKEEVLISLNPFYEIENCREYFDRYI